MKIWHVGLCMAFMAVGVALVVAGAGAFVFLAPLGCVAMMAMMVWMMAPSRFKAKVRGLAGGGRSRRAVTR